MKRIIIALMLCALFLTPSCDYVKSHNPIGKKKREAEAEALRKQQEEFRIADSIKVAEEKAARELALQMEKARAEEAERQARMSKYHIVVGSFLTPDYASSWLDHINQLGYSATLIDMDGGRWKLVSVGAYETLNEAWNALGNIQSKIIEEAWVFKPE